MLPRARCTRRVAGRKDDKAPGCRARMEVHMPIVAVTREMGSFGTEIAERAAAAIGIPLMHHAVIDGVAARWGVDRKLLLDLDFFRPPRVKHVRTQATYIAAQIGAEILGLAAKAEGAVFRGWGAAQLLFMVPHAVCVRIGAPFKVRLARLRERTRLGAADATRMLEDNDSTRAQLVRHHYRSDWRNYEGYDLVINTGRTSVDDAVSQILSLVRSPTFRETPKSSRVLANLRLEALARASLYANPATRQVRISIRADGTELHIGGIVDDGNQRDEVISTLGCIGTVVSVISRLRAPTDYRCRTSSI